MLYVLALQLVISLVVVTVPATLADDLNGTNRYSDVALAPDAAVLQRDAAQVYLVVRYSL